MTPKTIINRLGGSSAVAVMFGITVGAVSQWVKNGIPDSRLMYLRLARPDVFQEAPVKRRRKKEATHG